MASVLLTNEGLERIKTELERIKSLDINHCAICLGTEKQDISSLSMQDAKKGFYQKRILYLEDIIATSKIIDT
ncbi:hypothetical protein EJP82_26840 [Paenibacillus anaericanus]|uniref:Uncharacterized protein n=1 Tax=Paenibacillus anaericanus TaxID=170367 RepID=A0A433XVF2_9BACL|nr:hypothetical protein [Paenibacillus anaericanus]RUT38691.1 hypothetical protein EJP82_26840 [Paenibacillus anaericanus]